MSTKRHRCSWAETDPLLREYHDTEWGVPEFDGRALWEQLMLEGFQAGLSWLTVLRKREAFQASFHQFRPEAVASMGEDEILRLLANPGIIRSRAKIEATIGGARTFLRMQEAGLSFSDYAWQFVERKPIQSNEPLPTSTPLAETISRDLKRRGFKFVGPVITYAWMQAIGLVNDHAADCFRREFCARKSP